MVQFSNPDNSMRLKIGSISGIDVLLHWTYILAPAYIVYRLRWERNDSWEIIGILMVLLVTISFWVLLHELGHALMARRFGVGTKDIMITPIGGLARLERMPLKPIQELLITLAGPVVNFLIAIVFGVIVLVSGGPWIPSPDLTDLVQFPTIMMWVNLALFLFNLIPAFPMDGGRVLRSGLALVMPYSTATSIAGRFGQVCAVSFSIYGLLSAKYLLIVVGVFVFFAARFEMKQARWIDALRDPSNRIAAERELAE